MRPTKSLQRKITTALSLLVLLFSSDIAQAKNEISVKYVTGKNISSQKIANIENIYPGWTESRIIRVKNESERDNVDIYLQFKSANDTKLAEKINIYAIRISDGNYRLGGLGDSWSLKKANEKNLFIDKLKPKESKFYKIKIEFNKDAGNEYQDLSLKFDLDFKIQSRTNNLSDENIILNSQGRSGFTGNSSESTPDSTVADLSGSKNESIEKPSIMGARDENACSTWPAYAWILALVFYAFIFNLNNAYGKNSKKIKLFWQTAFTALAIFIWYHFDSCKTLIWFPASIFAIVAISYQYFLRKTGK